MSEEDTTLTFDAKYGLVRMEPPRLHIDCELRDKYKQTFYEFTRLTINMREQALRKGLINLGWTPPTEKLDDYE